MSENPFVEQGRVAIRVDKTRYSVVPSGKTVVTVTLRNQGLDEDRFALAVGGIPAAWVSSTQPVVSLKPGEEKETMLIIRVPAQGEVADGEIQLTVRATSQEHPGQFGELKTVLVIEAPTVLSRVEVILESAQFAVAPGSSTTFTMQVVNHGLGAESLRLFVDGIPTGWVSTPFPIVDLDPGEEQEVPVTIAPPRGAESRAGRHRITVRLASQEYPEQIVTIDGVLTISAFMQFESELEPPPPIEALQNAYIKVTNEGNINESFHINWESGDDLLLFELWQKEGDDAVFKIIEEHALKVEPGKENTVHFRGGLRKRPFVGGEKSYPFQVNVRSSTDELQTHTSEVIDKGIVPLWVIPLILVLCVTLACLGVFIYNWLQDDAPLAGDDSWARVEESGVLRVATSADYPPFSYHNENHIIDGFDAALIRDIGTKLGVQVQISDYAFEGLGATLQVGQADVAIAAISITTEREAQFDFSNIYYVGQDAILAKTDSGIDSIANVGDMAGKRFGVQQFTVYERWAQDVLVAGGILAPDQLFVYSKSEHALDDLRNGRLDLVMLDLQPATLALYDGVLKIVGQGLNQQRMAIALPKGANALREKINEALLELQNEGRVNQLIQAYLGLQPEDIIPPPTPEPTPAITSTPVPNPTEAPCVDAMEFIEDLNYDDEDLTNFPLVGPGEAFQKGWRIRNSGSCTWNSTYFIQYTHGNHPDAQMGGGPTAIQGAVEPGQNYDMYVDLVAPENAGEYVGYWQMFNGSNSAFGQKIWVAVEVRSTDPETPTATPAPTGEATPLPTATEIPAEPTATQEPLTPTVTEEPGSDLRDRTWILEGFLVDVDDDELTDPIAEVDLTMIFDEDGTFEGFAGCNDYSGDYFTDGTELSFQNITANKAQCDQPEGIMTQETFFLSLLEDIEAYRINQDQKLEVIRYITENDQRTDKIILLFYDMNIGPR